MRYDKHWSKWGCIAVAAGLVVGCGGEESEDEAAATALSSNRAPTISGSPPTTIVEGVTYSFAPVADDADGDPLIFGVDAKPGWLELDQTTGELSGTPRAGDVGMHRGISLWVSDGESTSVLPVFDLAVMPASRADNRPPVISGAPADAITVDQFYDFTPTASDPDGDALTFAIANRPSWATFDSATGRLSGSVDGSDIGIYQNVIINVTDGLASAALSPFVIVVNPTPSANTPPVISGTPPTIVLEGNAYSFRPAASDADGDALAFIAVNQPDWASFDSVTGELSGIPGTDDVGVYEGISIVANDGTASTALPIFSITVDGRNSSPQISGTPPTTATVGSLYSFTPSASDADGDALSFSITGRPSWASFDANTGRLRGTPAAGDVGSHAGIQIRVSDGSETASLATFGITVTSPPNSPPVISGSPATSVLQDTPYVFQPTATDSDGDTLTFTIVSQPSWATFDAATGRLEGTPTVADVGTYAGIVIGVSDGSEASSLPGFDIYVVQMATGSATLSWTPPTENTDGSPLMDLAGYSVHWGTLPATYTESAYIANQGVTTYVVENLLPGTTYYFAITARNQAGLESEFSNEASKVIP